MLLRFRRKVFHIIALISIVFLLSKSVSCSGLGKCPRFTSLPKFDINRFAGQWFEVERSFYLMELAASCTFLNLTLNMRGSLNVVASTTNRWTETVSVKSGMAIPMVEERPILRFKFKTQLPFMVARMIPGAGIYHILYTDYDNVAIVWSCSSYALMYSDKFWILGRSQDIPAPMRIEIYNKIRTYDLDPERLIISKNHNCIFPYE